MEQPPHLNLLGIPPVERQQTRFLYNNLYGLAGYTQRFASAVYLVDHVEEMISAIADDIKAAELDAARNPLALETMNELHARQNMFLSWISIAVRDSALSIYHFGCLLEYVRSSIGLCKTIHQNIDKDSLEAARRGFDSSFPKFRAIRDAVAHDAEQAANPQKLAKHGFSGKFESKNVEINGAVSVTLGLVNGRTLTMTWKNEVVTLDTTHEVHSKIVEVRDLVYKAFLPVSEALRGIDLGD